MTIIEDSSEFWTETLDSCSTWYDPTAYFFTYLIGYIMIWRKPLWGSVIIIVISIFYVIMGGLDGPPIFAVTGFLVGTFYLTYWFAKRRNELNIN